MSTKEELLHVEEEKDGTATVELPDSLLPTEEEAPEQKTVAEDSDEDHPDDSDAVRAARRARRRSKRTSFARRTRKKTFVCRCYNAKTRK